MSSANKIDALNKRRILFISKTLIINGEMSYNHNTVYAWIYKILFVIKFTLKGMCLSQFAWKVRLECESFGAQLRILNEFEL